MLELQDNKLLFLATLLGGIPWIAITSFVSIDPPALSLGVYLISTFVVYFLLTQLITPRSASVEPNSHPSDGHQ
jgi:hypothetical protein